MDRMSILPFIQSNARIFDLNGHTRGPQGVPCHIKVGPRRILSTTVDPDRFTMDFWSLEDNQVTYLYHQPIPQERDKDGILFFNAAAFLEQAGEKGYFLCRTEDYRRYKEAPVSDTLLATEYGAAKSLLSWTDLPMVYSYLFFAPGALKLNGQTVYSISWETFDTSSSAQSSAIRPLVETLLSGPHDLTQKDFLQALRRIKELTFNFLWLHTDHGKCTITTFLDEAISVSLKDDYPERCIPASRDPLKVIKLGLTLLNAPDTKALKRSLSRMYRQGTAKPEPDSEC